MSRFARAQAYPSRQITMIVPYPPGGPADVVGRIVAERMRAALRQPIIVVNVGGADGSIGIGRGARAKADGYTIVLGTSSTQVLNGGVHGGFKVIGPGNLILFTVHTVDKGKPLYDWVK
jgi:tripartite-type tricarboxylate transporter receptor subunit TctC